MELETWFNDTEKTRWRHESLLIILLVSFIFEDWVPGCFFTCRLWICCKKWRQLKSIRFSCSLKKVLCFWKIDVVPPVMWWFHVFQDVDTAALGVVLDILQFTDSYEREKLESRKQLKIQMIQFVYCHILPRFCSTSESDLWCVALYQWNIEYCWGYVVKSWKRLREYFNISGRMWILPTKY